MKYFKEDVLIGLQFKSKNSQKIYTIYKIERNRVYINWVNDKIGTFYNLNNVVKYFNNKDWIVINSIQKNYEIY